ncbi:hypothetical protein ABK905_02085 [Acerihabitans sp. KWT182]|uniref:Uncharacterized protein n=1 Tax=Acerihabitans sp. KWT182 TaxID=3157919 RepID=A0AAU7QB20_9GAMM
MHILPDEIIVRPLESDDGLRRWLPATDGGQPTVVTKYTLAETQQPIFWLDDNDQIWAQTPDGVKSRLYRQNSRHAVKDIVVSPDGGTVVLFVERTLHVRRALFYHLADMGSRSAEQDIDHFQEAVLTGSFLPGTASWVTDQGELYVPWENQWSFLNEEHLRWKAPEGFQPNFVSPDQHYLGYVKRNDNSHEEEIMLVNVMRDRSLLLRRNQPTALGGYGLGKVVSVGFSALNALVAVGFSDGYIEIFRIDGDADAAGILSLGFVRLPMGQLILSDIGIPKPKQMVMKFNNAFDRLLVFHDVGDYRPGLNGNGTYAMSEIYLAELA